MKTKENNYKNTIKSLLCELKSSNHVFNEFNWNGVDPYFTNKEISELIQDTKKNLSPQINLLMPSPIMTTISNEPIIHPKTSAFSPFRKSTDSSEDSILNELIDFKMEDLNQYKTEIPNKYQVGKNKLLGQEVKDGKTIKKFENHIIEVHSKNGNLIRVIKANLIIVFSRWLFYYVLCK